VYVTQVVIADESHNLKSLDAKRTKAVVPLLKVDVLGWVLLEHGISVVRSSPSDLTAAPIPDRPADHSVCVYRHYLHNHHQDAEVALCLSGTPVLNRPEEFFSQLQALQPSLFSDHRESC
jgi:hypothetical protein